MKINWSKLILSILICLAAGWLGSIFTTAAVQTWYAGINKPSFNPPNWIFAPVWTILFILLTIIYFYKISKTAAYLLLPYILWVSFAAFLNFTIWRLN